jgi:anti-anti-sigma factor
MAEEKSLQEVDNQDTICFAELSDGVVVIRVIGRGSYANSVEFKKLADLIAERHGAGNYHFIVDLDECATMDSTFMGVLASAGLRQKRDGSDRLIVVNANQQSSRLLHTLGLAHFITVRGFGSDDSPKVGDSAFQKAEPQSLSRSDQIAHMIEAHQKLCDIEGENAVRFESVLRYLNESLDREKKA